MKINTPTVTMVRNDDDKKRSDTKANDFPDQKSLVKGPYNDWEEDEHGIYYGLTKEEALETMIRDWCKALRIKVSNHDTHFDRRWGHILEGNRNTDTKTKASSGDANDRDAKTKAADKNEE
jgi:hypothetical protein